MFRKLKTYAVMSHTENESRIVTSEVDSMCKDPGRRESQVPLENGSHSGRLETGVCMLWDSSEQLVEGDY